MEVTDQIRSDIIEVAKHVRSHADRPYEAADRLMAIFEGNMIEHVHFSRHMDGTMECECGQFTLKPDQDKSSPRDLYIHAKWHQAKQLTIQDAWQSQ